MKILIIDDHEVVREGLQSALAARFDVVGTTGTGADALELIARLEPDIAVVDLSLPDMSGEDLCARIRTKFPSTAVIILTTYLSSATVRGALRAGAAAYVTKAAGLRELYKTLDCVGQARFSPGTEGVTQIVNRLHELVADRMTDIVLTSMEESALELAAEGLTNLAIGERLCFSESTIRSHFQKLKLKLGARTRTELIAKAIRLGVIVPAPEGRVDMP